VRARLLAIVVLSATGLIAHDMSAGGESSASALPAPVLGKRINLSPLSGKVSVRLPGERDFVRLTGPRQVPVRTVVDTRHGNVRLVSARDRSGGTQPGRFSQGLFQVRQSDEPGADGLTELRLRGGTPPAACEESAGASSLRRTLRRLRSRVKPGSSYRTRTSSVAATVRGTVWNVTDDCGEVETRVETGEVLVENFVRKTRRIVRTGGRFRTRGRYSAATVRGG
jgi:hypothetical protein